VAQTAQQFHDSFDFATDGGGVCVVAWRRQLNADEELLRKWDSRKSGIHGLTGSQSCVQWEVECYCFAVDDDLGNLLAINGVQNFVANGVGQREDDGQRVRATDAQQTEAVSLRVVALPEVSVGEAMEGTFVYLATNFQRKRGKRSQSVIPSECERAIFLGRYESDVISRCSSHADEVISPRTTALQAINPRRFPKYGTIQVVDDVRDCPFEEDVLHDFHVAFIAVAERLRITCDGR
jgi:hypothetical protein